MERVEVFKILNEERVYQETIWNADHDRNHCIADWILLMEHFIERAKTTWLVEGDAAWTMAEIRKATAVGVAALEHNDAMPRRAGGDMLC